MEEEQDIAADVVDEVPQDAGQVDQAPEEAPGWSPEVEEEARLLGWKSPDEWQGNKPQNYIDNPSEFMERLERIGPFRKFREHSEEKLRRMEAAIEAREARERERMAQDYQRQLDAVAYRQRQAVETADTQAWEVAERDRRRLEQQRPQEAPQQAQPDPQVVEYAASDGGGWLKDPLMLAEGQALIEAAPHVKGLPAMAQIEYARAQLEMRYPSKFKAKAPPKPRVDGGGQGVFKSKTGFDALPPDVRKEFKRQVERGRFADTKEDREFFYDAYTNG